jgi:hypothetical protein
VSGGRRIIITSANESVVLCCIALLEKADDKKLGNAKPTKKNETGENESVERGAEDQEGRETGSRTRKRLRLNQGDSKYCNGKKKRAHDASTNGRQIFKEHKNESTVSYKR